MLLLLAAECAADDRAEKTFDVERIHLNTPGASIARSRREPRGIIDLR
jgi:hypothetical protein